MKQKQDKRWPEAHLKLKTLYEARVPSGMSQEEFGQEYGLGTQGMVWQYLNGYTPLNYDAAMKFAEGLRCTIADISPEMDAELQRRMLPALGLKSWRRAAALALPFLLLAPLLNTATEYCGCVLCKIRAVAFRTFHANFAAHMQVS